MFEVIVLDGSNLLLHAESGACSDLSDAEVQSWRILDNVKGGSVAHVYIGHARRASATCFKPGVSTFAPEPALILKAR